MEAFHFMLYRNLEPGFFFNAILSGFASNETGNSKSEGSYHQRHQPRASVGRSTGINMANSWNSLENKVHRKMRISKHCISN